MSDIAEAHRVLTIEANAIAHLQKSLDENFSKAVDLAFQCQGKVVVSGMGKSGHIGRKIAATLSSTGTPSLFLHPAESSHGDMGIMSPGDILSSLIY